MRRFAPPITHWTRPRRSLSRPWPTLPPAIFDLHGALLVDKVTDAASKPLNGERGPGATLVVTPFCAAGQRAADDLDLPLFRQAGDRCRRPGRGAEAGLRRRSNQLSAVCRPLVPDDWLPDRPLHGRNSCEGAGGLSSGRERQHRQAEGSGRRRQEWDFKWDKPGFPGTIIAGKFNPPVSGAAPNIHVYTTAAHKAAAADYAGTALREFAYFTSTFGIPESTQLNVVELPDDTVPVVLGAGNRRRCRHSHRRQERLSPAGQHHRPPVVGQRGQPGHAQRRLDHQRHGALRRADVSGRRRRAHRRSKPRFRTSLPARSPTTRSRSPSAGTLAARSLRSSSP